MDYLALIVCATLCVASVAANAGLLVLDGHRRARVRRELLAYRIPPAPAPDVDGVASIDYDHPMIGPVPHAQHVWPPHDRPFSTDATSRSYRCQVPRCQKTHTVATR